MHYEKVYCTARTYPRSTEGLGSTLVILQWTSLAIADHAAVHKWKYFKSPKSVLFDGPAAVGIESSKVMWWTNWCVECSGSHSNLSFNLMTT